MRPVPLLRARRYHRVVSEPLPVSSAISTDHDPFAFVGLTYDDVLLLPGETDAVPRAGATTSRLTKDISLAGPFSSPAVVTVTEARMASAMARQDAHGVMHHYQPIAHQA